MAFYVSGRESEAGWSSDPRSPYHLYREKSSIDFIEYIERQNLIPSIFKDENELEVYSNHIFESYLDTNKIDIHDPNHAEAATLKSLFYGAHCVDLIRLWLPEKISQNTIYDLLKSVPDEIQFQPEVQHKAFQLFGFAADLSRKMGDSVVTEYDSDKRICQFPPERLSLVERNAEGAIHVWVTRKLPGIILPDHAKQFPED